jgi:two-component system cell cycle sensor histidine kinase/response regulator CckA
MRWRRRLAAPALFEQIRDTASLLVAVLLDDASGPACVIDPSGLLVRCNSALVALCSGLTTKVGQNVTELFSATDRDAICADITATMQAEPAVPRSCAAMMPSGNEEVNVRLVILPLHGGGALLRFTDLSEQRQLEARLAHSQKLQATGQLAGGIAHDFNNLLTAILGAADGILGRDTDPETRDDAAQIRDSAQRGAALVRQLLAFGRQQRLEPRVMAVNAAIEDVSGLLRRLLGGQIRLVLALEQPGRQIRADPSQFDQVLINLAVNARDAMQTGGELIVRSGHITLYRPMLLGAETVPPGRYVMIEVHDTGEGIPPEVLPRIFDPFFTTKRERGGSGLGLSTVHGIVRQSDGFLAVDSERGRGTSVRIYLPRCEGASDILIPPPPIQAMAAAPPEVKRGWVLLVDDEDPVRRLASRALTRAGWEVIDADSGESALEMLVNLPESPVAMVSDMVMPGMDGGTLCRAVRARINVPNLPVILVSGYVESHIQQGLDGASTRFLAKPYSLAELVATLSDMLQSKASTDG